MSRLIVVTGGTGFLGRNLVPLLLKDRQAEVCLVSRSPELPANFHQCSATGRLRVVVGDVTNPDLITSDSDRQFVRTNVTNFIHAVASTNFSESRRSETERLNLCGTQNVLTFLRACPHLERLVHISTAYVANREQAATIYEDDPVRLLGQANPYEQSKARAELAVRASGLPWVILRPGIFSGHSVSASSGHDHRMGYGVLIGLLYTILVDPSVGGFDGFWRFRSARNGQSSCNDAWLDLGKKRLTGFPDVTKNFMFIDDIVGQMMSVISCSDSVRKTFHIVTKTPITTEEMLSSIQRALRVRGLHFAGDVCAERVRDTLERRAARFITTTYGPYFLRYEPQWDTSNTDRCLELAGYSRIDMTPERFDWLMEEYVTNELCDVLRGRIPRRLPS